MKKIIIKLFCTVSLIICIECINNKNPRNAPGLNIINPISQTKEIEDFNNLVEDINIIPLELTKNSTIINVRKILLTSNNKIIILNAKNILVFNTQGRFLFQIGKIGKGPGEYININDICLDFNEKYIYALDSYNKVLKYSLEDGTFKDESFPQWDTRVAGSFDGICPAISGYYLFCANPSMVDNFNDDFYCLNLFNWDGKLKSKYLKRMDFCFNILRFTQSYDNSYFIRPLEGTNYLYKINRTGLNKILKIDFGPKQIPVKYIFTFPGNPFQNIHNYIMSQYYKLPIGFHDTKDYLYFYFSGLKGESVKILLEKKNMKGFRWHENDRFPLSIFASDSKYFYCIYNDYLKNTTNDNRQLDPLKMYIKNKNNLKSLDTKSNPLLIKIKFNFYK